MVVRLADSDARELSYEPFMALGIDGTAPIHPGVSFPFDRDTADVAL